MKTQTSLPARLPNFNIKVRDIVPKTKELIADVENTTKKALSKKEHTPLRKGSAGHTWESLIASVDSASNELSIYLAAVGHLHDVANTPELRKAYMSAEQLYSRFATKMSQNEKLFRAYENLYARADELSLDDTQREILKDALRDFRLAGVDLPKEKRAQLKKINERLSKTSTSFGNNVLDATNNYELHIKDESRLDGVTEDAKKAARAKARATKKDGFLLTLDAPSFTPIMERAHDRALREEIYKAYNSRASDIGPHAKKLNNDKNIETILRLRAESAKLRSFKNFAEVSIVRKMATRTRDVEQLLKQLAKAAKKKARDEMRALKALAKADGIAEIKPWDVGYYFEKLRERDYAFSSEEVREYFPAPKVLGGIFTIIEKLYGVRFIQPKKQPKKYHDDVLYYSVYRGKKLIGGIYLDLYARKNKSGGAWANDFVSRMKIGNETQLPVALVVCNFTPPTKYAPSHLAHYEVLTLFHEMGHALHVLLTEIDYADASGFSGVEWDAVELPSQFFENWAWDKKILQTLLTEHKKTKKPIPTSLVTKMLKAKNYDSGYAMMRQLMLSMFDFSIHTHANGKTTINSVYKRLDIIKKEMALMPTYKNDRFAHAFSHIFGGGYAAGYYSYKWAEVLSADAFAPFKKAGLLSRKQGQKFLDEILSRGGSRTAMENFVAYRGRKPKIDALLEQEGLI